MKELIHKTINPQGSLEIAEAINKTLMMLDEWVVDFDTITSSDLGYIDGHAWIGKVEPNTSYKIIVSEEK